MLGILDSGIGGLALLNAIKLRIPKASLFYLADSKRAPFGTLTKKDLLAIAKQDCAYLLQSGASSVAIACHSISTNFGLYLQKLFAPFPVFLISSCFHLSSTFQKICLLGTAATLRSLFYQKLYPQKNFFPHQCPKTCLFN